MQHSLKFQCFGFAPKIHNVNGVPPSVSSSVRVCFRVCFAFVYFAYISTTQITHIISIYTYIFGVHLFWYNNNHLLCVFSYVLSNIIHIRKCIEEHLLCVLVCVCIVCLCTSYASDTNRVSKEHGGKPSPLVFANACKSVSCCLRGVLCLKLCVHASRRKV